MPMRITFHRLGFFLAVMDWVSASDPDSDLVIIWIGCVSSNFLRAMRVIIPFLLEA